MRTDLSAAFIAQIEAEAAFMVVAGKFSIGGQDYCWCDGTIPFYLLNDKYSPVGLRIDGIEAESGVSMMRADVSIPNANDAIGSVLLGADPREAPVLLYWAALNSSGMVAVSGTASGLFFRGMIDDWDLDYESDIVRLRLVNELIYWQSNTLLKSDPTCPWPFKDTTTCRYAGAEAWCDQTWERCSALGNTINYGGDLYLPEIAERQVWWGKGVTP